jgi:hypothetical protein
MSFHIRPDRPPKRQVSEATVEETVSRLVRDGEEIDLARIKQFLDELTPEHGHARPATHLWGESAEGVTHGFGDVDDATAKKRLDDLTVGALQRAGFQAAVRQQ